MRRFGLLVLPLVLALACTAPSSAPPDAATLPDARLPFDAAPAAEVGACGPCDHACCELNMWGTRVPPFCPPTRFWECGGGPRVDAGPVDAPGEPDTLDRVSCGATPPVFPAFSRWCSFHPDCVTVRHQVDCCGSFARIGISEGYASAFAAAEAECESEYPDCDCAAQPDLADDGTTGAPTDAATVRCVDFVCTTTFAPGP